MKKCLITTDIPGALAKHQGKVRDIYDFGQNILIVATDRISCFDHVLLEGIPSKGKILNELSLFWFNKIKDKVSNHLVSSKVKDFPEIVQDFLLRGNNQDFFRKRLVLVKKLKMLPLEFIVRGYIAGSLWKEYQAGNSVFQKFLPPNLLESQKLPCPIFTPSTKAISRHDQNISLEQMVSIIDIWLDKNLLNLSAEVLAEKIRSVSLTIYYESSYYAENRHVIIADTKFEFGLDENNQLVLADELLTPDSSRFWPLNKYCVGQPQESFDKQYVRDWLDKDAHWDRQPPPPHLPDEIIKKTELKYREAFLRLTGEVFRG